MGFSGAGPRTRLAADTVLRTNDGHHHANRVVLSFVFGWFHYIPTACLITATTSDTAGSINLGQKHGGPRQSALGLSLIGLAHFIFSWLRPTSPDLASLLGHLVANRYEAQSSFWCRAMTGQGLRKRHLRRPSLLEIPRRWNVSPVRNVLGKLTQISTSSRGILSLDSLDGEHFAECQRDGRKGKHRVAIKPSMAEAG